MNSLVAPYLHIGRLAIPTYGLMMWVSLVFAYFVLQKDIARRKLSADAANIVFITAFAGVLGAKIYHELEDPAEFLFNLQSLFRHGEWHWLQVGYAWFGGFLAGVATLLLLARHYRVGMLRMLDLCSPAAILGYGIGRLGCLFSGDGDYGIPTNLPWGMSFNNGLVPSGPFCRDRGLPWDCGMHPTPIYELLAALLIFWFLWRAGDPKRGPKPAGTILALYLLLSGLERFLVEFIRLNPHSAFGIFSNAQFMALLSMIAGAVLFAWVRRVPHPSPAGH